MVPRALQRAWKGTVVGICLLLISPSARAREYNGNVDFYHPSPHLSDTQALHTADGTTAGTMAAGFMLDVEAPRAAEIQSRVTSSFAAAIGLPWSLEFGLVLPVILHNGGDQYALGRVLRSSGAGDLQLHLKYVFDTPSIQLFRFALAGFVSFPTGSSEGLYGHSTVTFRPDIVVQTQVAELGLALNAGLFLRGEDSFGPVDVGPEITYGLAIWLPVLDGAIVPSVEVRGATELTSPFADEETSPLEINLAISFRFWQLRLLVGGGAGVTGYTAATYRAMVGLAWIPGWNPLGGIRDKDNDGIQNGQDRCPTNPDIL